MALMLFIKDVRPFILEVLRSHCVVKHNLNEHEPWVKLNGRRTKRIQKLLSVFILEGGKFTASTADVRVDVERLPQMINRAETRHGTDVKEDANVGPKNGPKRIKEPDQLWGSIFRFFSFEHQSRRNSACRSTRARLDGSRG